MYLDHYGLSEPPFSITPLTDFFYTGARRGSTLEALIYALTHVEGIVKVVGEVGSGKTMLCRVLMERLPPAVETVYLCHPALGPDELLYAVADELGLNLAGERQTQALKALSQALIDKHVAGKYVVVLVDEAHAMSIETLEALRLLSNLETGRHKLLRIVLFGQPELDTLLSRPQMRQLRDRITHSFQMLPLEGSAVGEYLTFRLRAAGYRGPDLFSPAAVRAIARASRGLTRRINILADKALLAAFVEGSHRIEPRHVKLAIRDSALVPRRRPFALALTLCLLAAGLAAGAGWFYRILPLPEADPAGTVQATMTVLLSKESSAPQGQAAFASTQPPPEGGAEEASREPPASASAFPESALDASPLLGQRVAAAKKLLETRPGDSYSVQLFLTNDIRPARMERFLQRARERIELEKIYVYPTRTGGQPNFAVLYGSFDTREEGLAALERLPSGYRSEFAPIVRRLDEIKAMR
ncbi:AAA family ATPase [Pelomicrobium sp.]|uniref:AAA family ATPase n=1 Tax=Pelomicrobium sp. TaxID=2815319 RepID=UPI002FDEA288